MSEEKNEVTAHVDCTGPTWAQVQEQHDHLVREWNRAVMTRDTRIAVMEEQVLSCIRWISERMTGLQYVKFCEDNGLDPGLPLREEPETLLEFLNSDRASTIS